MYATGTGLCWCVRVRRKVRETDNKHEGWRVQENGRENEGMNELLSLPLINFLPADNEPLRRHRGTKKNLHVQTE